MICLGADSLCCERRLLGHHTNNIGAEWVFQNGEDVGKIILLIFLYVLDDKGSDFRDGFRYMRKISMVVCITSITMAAHNTKTHKLAQVLAYARGAKTWLVKLGLLHFVNKVAEVAAILGLIDMGEELKPQRV